jgi:hypothetical protein
MPAAPTTRNTRTRAKPYSAAYTQAGTSSVHEPVDPRPYSHRYATNTEKRALKTGDFSTLSAELQNLQAIMDSYSKGKFTQDERQRVAHALENYRIQYNIQDEFEIRALISPKTYKDPNQPPRRGVSSEFLNIILRDSGINRTLGRGGGLALLFFRSRIAANSHYKVCKKN